MMRLSAWLRALESAQHLFDPDVSYFIVTASSISSQCKTAVVSAQHSRLLDMGEIISQNYSVLRPPPIADGFRGAYQALHDGINDGSVTHLSTADIPATAPAVPAHHILAPDRITQLDMKLRNNLLALITSRGRRRHYQERTQSGCELLRILAADAKASTSLYVQSPHTRKLKAQLEELRKVTMTKISMVEFDEIRDGIEEINDQLSASDKMTDVQLCDHYIGLIHKLNSHGVRLALEIKLTSNMVPFGDVAQTVNTINQVLTSFLINDEVASIASEAPAPGRMLAVTGDDTPRTDPAKNQSRICLLYTSPSPRDS